MHFSEHYFTEKKMSVFRRFANIFTSDKKYSLDVDKMFILKPLSIRGFNEVTDKISNMYTRSKKKQQWGTEAEHKIIQIYRGILKGNNKKLKEFDIDFNNEDQDIAVYETEWMGISGTGIVALLSLIDKNDNRLYYVASDKSGSRWFTEVFGKLITTFAAINKPTTGKKEKEPDYEPTKEPDEEEITDYISLVKKGVKTNKIETFDRGVKQAIIPIQGYEFDKLINVVGEKYDDKEQIKNYSHSIQIGYKYKIDEDNYLYLLKINISGEKVFLAVIETKDTNTGKVFNDFKKDNILPDKYFNKSEYWNVGGGIQINLKRLP